MERFPPELLVPCMAPLSHDLQSYQTLQLVSSHWRAASLIAFVNTLRWRGEPSAHLLYDEGSSCDMINRAGGSISFSVAEGDVLRLQVLACRSLLQDLISCTLCTPTELTE